MSKTDSTKGDMKRGVYGEYMALIERDLERNWVKNGDAGCYDI